MIELSLIQKIAIGVLPILFAITLHEVAHGWVARHYGDSTAYMMGRLTLNPLKHIDPIGTVLVPMLLLALGGFLFGWAKPVPVNYRNLRHPKRDMAFVALAGPLANLAMAIFWAVVAKIGISLAASQPMPGEWMMLTGSIGVTINIALMVLNLLPLPPLDGGRIMTSILPVRYAIPFSKIEPYGFFIILGLLATGLLGKIMQPLMDVVYRLVLSLVGG